MVPLGLVTFTLKYEYSPVVSLKSIWKKSPTSISLEPKETMKFLGKSSFTSIECPAADDDRPPLSVATNVKT